MNEAIGYTPKTESEICNMSTRQIIDRLNEVIVIMAQHKQVLDEIHAIELANFDVMEIAANAVIDAQQSNADKAILDKYDTKYREAQKRVANSLTRRRALVEELAQIYEEVTCLSKVVAAIEDGVLDRSDKDNSKEGNKC